MKKLLTIALAIICMAVLAGLAAGQGAQQKDKPKSPPTSGATKPAPTSPPAATARNSAHATEQVMTGTVTKVNDKDKSFAVTANGKEVYFSGKNLKAPFPKLGDFVDVTYTDPPKPGDPPAATTVKGSRSNTSEYARVPRTENQMVTGEVTDVNRKEKTFTVTANGKKSTFSAEKMKGDFTRFTVGERIEVTYYQTTPGGPMVAAPDCCTRGSKSNTSERVMRPDFGSKPAAGQVMAGTVTNVDEKAQTFTIKTAKGEQFTFTFSAKQMPQPKKDDQVDVTYIQKTPGGPMEARTATIKSTKSNASERVASDAHSAQQITGKVLRVNKEAKTFTIMTKGNEVTFSAEKLALPEVGKTIDITYTPNPGGANRATTVKTSHSNSY